MALRIARSVAKHGVAASLWATREYSVLPSWVAAEAGIKGATTTTTTTTSPRRRRKFGLLVSGAALVWLATLVGVSSVAWLIYNHTANVLPTPVSEDAAGKDGFSEERALRHVKFLTDLGPRPVASTALHQAVQYVLDQALEVKGSASAAVAVDVEHFYSKPGSIQLEGPVFSGKTLVYAGQEHVVVRVRPQSDDGNAQDNSVLVSAHIDSVVTGPGAGDDASSIAVMIEVLRALSSVHFSFKNSVIFLFNTAEEEGATGSHSFITQHPWCNTIRAAVNLEALGIGGKHYLFQGPESWVVDLFAKTAKHPAGMVTIQDVFHSGIISSGTDFQIYREVQGLPGLDFAYMDNAAVYHTPNDKFELLKPGSLQHSGDNLLPFLFEVATLPDLAVHNSTLPPGPYSVVYFDVLGLYMVSYSKDSAKYIHGVIIVVGLVLFQASVCLSGVTGLIALGLAVFAILLTWIFAFGITLLVARLVVPYLSSFAIPFIVNQWMVIGLYGAPALFGALLGQHFGHGLLVSYLAGVHTKLMQTEEKGTPDQGTKEIIATRAQSLAEGEAERWLFKAGILQWLVVLGLGTWVNAGSAYLALAMVLGPAIAYGLIEIQLSPKQSSGELHWLTFWLGMLIPFVLTSFPVIRITYLLISKLIDIDTNPGSLPEWFGSVVVGALVAAIVCLMFVYLLPYAHRSGGFLLILGPIAMLAIVVLGLLALNVFPAFTPNLGREINVVHVINTSNHSVSSSYVSLASVTMGRLDEEARVMNDTGLFCGESDGPDFASYVVRYGCRKKVPLENLENDLLASLPSLEVIRDDELQIRQTTVNLSTGASYRWALAINTDKIQSFKLETPSEAGPGELLVPQANATGVNGWHKIQYNSNSTDPHEFVLTLYWSNNSVSPDGGNKSDGKLLSLRTDANIVTGATTAVLEKLPPWCVNFGKSFAPYYLAYLAELEVQFSGATVKHTVA